MEALVWSNINLKKWLWEEVEKNWTDPWLSERGRDLCTGIVVGALITSWTRFEKQERQCEA